MCYAEHSMVKPLTDQTESNLLHLCAPWNVSDSFLDSLKEFQSPQDLPLV